MADVVRFLVSGGARYVTGHRNAVHGASNLGN